MPRSTECPKCGGAMSTGFLLDKSYGRQDASLWVEGEPVESFWTGVKLRGRKQLPITTWRCGRCGYLENYAN